jgi:hypothetical protein
MDKLLSYVIRGAVETLELGLEPDVLLLQLAELLLQPLLLLLPPPPVLSTSSVILLSYFSIIYQLRPLLLCWRSF